MPTDLPFRDTSPERLARLRAGLHEAGYTGERICRRLGIPSLFEFKSLRGGRPDAGAPSDPLDVLVRLFLDGEGVPARAVDEALGDGLRADLEATGLLDEHPDGEGVLAATALLYPVGGVWVVSDVSASSPGVHDPTAGLRSDAVYPPLTGSARDFLTDLPRSPCHRLLDLCAGTGIAALLSAPVADRVWALDITGRSTAFARFNAALNGVENLTALEGDLYDPVRGETFDRIVAHPPYVPSAGNDPVFRDGGEDGEQILRRIVEGLPEHLEPGGLLFARAMGSDRRGFSLERRIRAWLGASENEFDVFVVVSRVADPSQQIALIFLGGRIAADAARRQLELFRSLGVEGFVHASIFVRRRASERPTVTVRRTRGDHAGWRDLEWLVEFEAEAAHPDYPTRLLELRPRLRDGTSIDVEHRIEGGRPIQTNYRISSTGAFATAFDLPFEAEIFLPLFDGTRTVAEVWETCLDREWIPAGTPAAQFAGLVRTLIGGCVLELEG